MSEYKINNGGPAFPCEQGHVPEHGWNQTFDSGMSLRDYFIAHAPAEPQPWFEPVMPTRRPAPKLVDNDDPGRVFKSWQDAERIVGVDGYHDANLDIAQEWDMERRKQRYIQWPAAWADEMLKARQKPRVEGV